MGETEIPPSCSGDIAEMIFQTTHSVAVTRHFTSISHCLKLAQAMRIRVFPYFRTALFSICRSWSRAGGITSTADRPNNCVPHPCTSQVCPVSRELLLLLLAAATVISIFTHCQLFQIGFFQPLPFYHFWCGRSLCLQWGITTRARPVQQLWPLESQRLTTKSIRDSEVDSVASSWRTGGRHRCIS